MFEVVEVHEEVQLELLAKLLTSVFRIDQTIKIPLSQRRVYGSMVFWSFDQNKIAGSIPGWSKKLSKMVKYPFLQIHDVHQIDHMDCEFFGQFSYKAQQNMTFWPIFWPPVTTPPGIVQKF